MVPNLHISNWNHAMLACVHGCPRHKALVDIARRVIEDTKHGYNAGGDTIGAADHRITCADVVNVNADSASVLADKRAVFKSVVNPRDRIIKDAHQEATAILLAGGTTIKQRGCGMHKEPL